MDHHTIAAVSITGICLDVLGGLYLAYDLLGGQHGPLRLITRAVTYSIIFGTGYALGLGLFFGVVAGAATGITLAIELHRYSRQQDHYPLAWEGIFSAIRAAAWGIGLYSRVGLRFAAAFAAFITAGQLAAYTRGVRPTLDYEASRRSRITKTQFWAAVVRTIGYTAATFACRALIRHERDWAFALRIGLVIGLVTAIGTAITPHIEYYADHLPERKMGVFGVWPGAVRVLFAVAPVLGDSVRYPGELRERGPGGPAPGRSETSEACPTLLPSPICGLVSTSAPEARAPSS